VGVLFSDENKDGGRQEGWKIPFLLETFYQTLKWKNLILNKCERYLGLKRIAETSQNSDIKLLSDLFIDREGEIMPIFLKNYGVQHVFQVLTFVN
jgi:hypothetical protein